MRVVYLSVEAGLGGAERVLLDVVAAARRSLPGARLAVVLGAEGPLASRLADLGAETRVLPLPASLSGLGDSSVRLGRAGTARVLLRAGRAAADTARYAAALRRELAALEPDLIHSNGLKFHLLGRLAAPAGVPVLWHVHDYLGRRAVARRLLRAAASSRTIPVAISPSVLRDLEAALPGRSPVLLENAVDVSAFAPGPGDTAWLDGVSGLSPASGPQPVRVGLVSTWARWKGHDVFLGAAGKVLARGGLPPVRFHVVGGAIYRTAGSQWTEDELRSRARDAGAAASTGFAGFQEDVARVHRALDVVVHASTEPEPFGRTIVEAMACGRAVVASAAGGAAELVRDGVDALAVPPGDVDALAAAIERLASDAALRARLGAAARETALRRFSTARLDREVAALYERALTAGGRP